MLLVFFGGGLKNLFLEEGDLGNESTDGLYFSLPAEA
jgi:hypothetical protein